MTHDRLMIFCSHILNIGFHGGCRMAGFLHVICGAIFEILLHGSGDFSNPLLNFLVSFLEFFMLSK